MIIHLETQNELIDVIDLDSRATSAKLSDNEAEMLIQDFLPFLNSRVSRYMLKHDEHQHDDLLNIALLAFYEAIQKFDSEKGHFFPFANRVVCRRIIDQLRVDYRDDGKTISLEDTDNESDSSAAHDEISIRQFEIQSQQEDLVYEIEQLEAELTGWGITMDILVKQSPKHKRLRETYKMVVFEILQNPDIIQTIQIKRYFPIKSISEITKIPQKKLERARTFILASLLIKMGDYDLLAEYVESERRQS